MARPRNVVASITLEIAATPQLVAYIDSVKELGLFGSTRAEVCRQMIQRVLAHLLAAKLIERAEKGPDEPGQVKPFRDR
jgi:hypothetical protein